MGKEDVAAVFYHYSGTRSSVVAFAFSPLTLLVGRQEEHRAYKKSSVEMLTWLPVCIEVQKICILSS